MLLGLCPTFFRNKFSTHLNNLTTGVLYYVNITWILELLLKLTLLINRHSLSPVPFSLRKVREALDLSLT